MKTKQKGLIIILCIITVGSLALTGYLLFGGTWLKPDYAPGTIDTNAIPDPDDSEKMKSSGGGGAVSLSYSNIVAVSLKTNKLKLYFKNPSKSNQDMVIQVFINKNGKETLIAKSNRLPAGYIIKSLDLESNVKLTKGGYNGLFKVYYYNSDTDERAVLDTNIEIKLEVQ